MEKKIRLIKKQIIINNSFKNLYANLALNLVNKLPHAPNKFDLDSVLAYYKRFLNTENHELIFLPTSEDEVLKSPKDTNPEKAAVIDNIREVFKRWCSCFSFTNIKTM